MKLDVVIVSHQSATTLTRALQSASRRRPSSSSTTRRRTARSRSHDGPASPSSATTPTPASPQRRTRVLRSGARDLILFLNPDARIDPTSLAQLVARPRRTTPGSPSPRPASTTTTGQSNASSGPIRRRGGAGARRSALHRSDRSRSDVGFVDRCVLPRPPVGIRVARWVRHAVLALRRGDGPLPPCARRRLAVGGGRRRRRVHVGGASGDRAPASSPSTSCAGGERFVRQARRQPADSCPGGSPTSSGPRSAAYAPGSPSGAASTAPGSGATTGRSRRTDERSARQPGDRGVRPHARRLLARGLGRRVAAEPVPRARAARCRPAAAACCSSSRRSTGCTAASSAAPVAAAPPRPAPGPSRRPGRSPSNQSRCCPAASGASRRPARCAAGAPGREHVSASTDPTLWINDASYRGLLADRMAHAVRHHRRLAHAGRRPHRQRTSARGRRSALLERAERVVVCSDGTRRIAPAALDTMSRLIPNAVDVEHFAAPHDRPDDLPHGAGGRLRRHAARRPARRRPARRAWPARSRSSRRARRAGRALATTARATRRASDPT